MRLGRADQFVLREDGLDLRMGQIGAPGRVQHALAIRGRNFRRHIDIVGEIAADQRRPAQAELFAQSFAHIVRQQCQVHAFGGNATLAVALRDIHAAMIGRERKDIRQLALVQFIEQTAERAIEGELLRAHLRAFRSVVVTGVVGACEADGQQIRRVALTELQRIECGQRGIEGERIQLRRPTPAPRVGFHFAQRADAQLVRHGLRLGARRALRRQLYFHTFFVRSQVRRIDLLLDRSGNARTLIGIGDETGIAPPQREIRLVTAQHHRRAILARYRNDARVRIHILHAIAQRRHFQQIWRNHLRAHIAACGPRLLGTVDGVALLAVAHPRQRRILPIVRDDAAARRPRAGENRGMSGTGLGRGVALVTARIHDALGKPRQSVPIERPILREDIGGELIDGDSHHQFRLGQIGIRCER